MNPPAEHFTGKDGLSRTQLAEVCEIAARLAGENRDTYRYLWSAAAYLVRAGEPLNDARVKAEATRRRDLFNAAMARNAAKRAEWAKEEAAA